MALQETQAHRERCDDNHDRSHRVSAVVPYWLHTLVRQDAQQQMISVSAIVRGILARHYEAGKPQPWSQDVPS